MIILVNFNAREEEKYNLMQSDAHGDNRDALALSWAERYIHRQSQVDARLIPGISWNCLKDTVFRLRRHI